MKGMQTAVAVVMAGLLLAGCDKAPSGPVADAIYHGGPILTMAGDEPAYVEALAVRDGRIQFTGTLAQASALKGEATRDVDLAGRALLPGFIDAHGHIANVGFQALSANLLPPPDGDGQSIGTLVALLKDWAQDNNRLLQESGWIIGFGYDDSQLAEKRHPTADDLDRVSTERPVLIVHQSGHLGVLNHKGLEMAGYGSDTPDPAGGVIRRGADGVTPDGVLEEMAFFAPLFSLFATFDQDMKKALALAGVDAYTAQGFTTAQEGRSDPGTAETWRS
ncbi:MAG: amidohydrolase, partial [Alcanivoracaceae bacterium]